MSDMSIQTTGKSIDLKYGAGKTGNSNGILNFLKRMKNS